MAYLFELSGEHEELSCAEIRGCAQAAGFSLRERGEGYLLADTGAPPEIFGNRCGLLWRVDDVILDTAPDALMDGIGTAVKDMGLNGTFAVRAKVKDSYADTMKLQKEAGRIISEMKGMTVNLTEPDNLFRIFVCSERAFFATVAASVDRSLLEQRKVQNRPFFSPISIHPKYARVLINLARASGGARILDPFCGTGGILIEAAKVDLSPLGSDISQEMIEGSARNLEYEGLKAELKRCDVSSIRNEFGEVDAIVTDPPYGRASSTNREDIESLYSRMLAAFCDTVRPNGYISLIVPDISMIERLPDGLVFRESYSLRVHRSLTRNFVVLQRTE